MKGFALCVLLVVSSLMLSGCCSDNMCDYLDLSAMSTVGNDTYQCSNCTVCGSCGYNRNYRDIGWY